MAYNHFFDTLTNTSGDSLIGYFARVIDPATGNVEPIYSDINGTPVSVVSGVANMAKTDDFGNISLYVDPGTYNLDIYAPDAVTFRFRVPNVAMNSSKGDKGDQGDTGAPGPADNTYASLATFKASDISRKVARLVGASGITDGSFNWTPGNFTGQADDQNIIKADSTALSVGAWVRQALSDLRGTTNVKITDDRLLLGAATPSPDNHAVSVTVTRRTDDENGQDIYFYSNQTDPDNQRVGRVLHIYADADGDIIDMVGTKVGQKIRQAWNPAARSDKGPYYVGSGWFTQYLRTRPNGGGIYPGGNVGGNTDRLTGINPYGNLVFYGSDAQEWNESPDTAPIQIGTYEYFLTRKGYFGYKPSTKSLIIGSIDTNTGTFERIQFNATAADPPADNTMRLGGLGSRYSQVTASQFKPGSGAPIWTSGTGSPEGSISAPPGSLYTNEAGGAGSTLWIKESGSGNTGWIAK